MISLKDIEAAAERIKGRVTVTPCPQSIPLGELTGMQIYCKLEYLQRTGSFKERGACNALQLLNPDQQRRGVIAASAGNHGLGLAYHAKLLGIPAVIVMPMYAPLTKVINCQKLGAEVVLHGNNFEEARAHADEIAENRQLTYINGFDDLPIIAGQGTIALELLQQVPDMDAIVIPIGGGGLIAGISLVLKKLKPSIKIIGVEPKRAASLSAALKAGEPVAVNIDPTLADGLAVAKVGAHAFSIARELIDEVLLVDEHEIAIAILRLLELEKCMVEGAGAATLAACLSDLAYLKGKKVVLPLTGGNIDVNVLGRVLERGLASDGRLCQLTATISDRPGGLARFASILAEEGASIMEIDHDRAFAGDDINRVTVHCVIETRDFDHIARVRQRLAREGFNLPV